MHEYLNQPLSFWILYGILLVGLCAAGMFLLIRSRLNRNGQLLAGSAVLLFALSFAILLYPVQLDGASCGIGAGATGWSEADLQPWLGATDAEMQDFGSCRAAQWRFFAIGLSVFGMGIVAMFTPLIPRFRAHSISSQ